jgi:hypothetical protein
MAKVSKRWAWHQAVAFAPVDALLPGRKAGGDRLWATVCRLLSLPCDLLFKQRVRVENSSFSRQGRSDPSSNPARGPHHICPRLERNSSPLLQDLIFGTDRRSQACILLGAAVVVLAPEKYNSIAHWPC